LSLSERRSIDDVANLVIAQMLFLESEDPDKDVHLYINSPGGIVTSGLAIYDTMQYIRPKVSTLCMDKQPVLRLCFWQQGRRENDMLSPFENPDPSTHGRFSGTGLRCGYSSEGDPATSRRTESDYGQTHFSTVDRIQADTDRDFYMTGHQAKEYGIIDEVVIKRPVRSIG